MAGAPRGTWGGDLAAPTFLDATQCAAHPTLWPRHPSVGLRLPLALASAPARARDALGRGRATRGRGRPPRVCRRSRSVKLGSRRRARAVPPMAPPVQAMHHPARPWSAAARADSDRRLAMCVIGRPLRPRRLLASPLPASPLPATPSPCLPSPYFPYLRAPQLAWAAWYRCCMAAHTCLWDASCIEDPQFRPHLGHLGATSGTVRHIPASCAAASCVAASCAAAAWQAAARPCTARRPSP